MDVKRLTSQQLDEMAAWARTTLAKDLRDKVLALVEEARAHRALLGRMHDDLINEMS